MLKNALLKLVRLVRKIEETPKVGVVQHTYRPRNKASDLRRSRRTMARNSRRRNRA